MSKGDTDAYLVKAPVAMLDRWREEAQRRGVSLAQLIRYSVNKEIGEDAGFMSAEPLPTIVPDDH